MDIQIIPIVSEKANAISEKSNRFSFKVSPEANKYQIKDLAVSKNLFKRFITNGLGFKR